MSTGKLAIRTATLFNQKTPDQIAIEERTNAMYARGREYPRHTELISTINDLAYRIEGLVRSINRAIAEVKTPRKINKFLTHQTKEVERLINRLQAVITQTERDAGGMLPGVVVARGSLANSSYMIENGNYDKTAPKQGIFMIYTTATEVWERTVRVYEKSLEAANTPIIDNHPIVQCANEAVIQARTILAHLSDF